MVTQPMEEPGLGRKGFPAEATSPFPFLLNEESKGNSIVAGHGKRHIHCGLTKEVISMVILALSRGHSERLVF
jgi:hypothetical protein